MSDSCALKAVACKHCDWMLVDPKTGESIVCPRCGHQITRFVDNAPLRTVSFATTALTGMILALWFPFLGFSAGGREQTMTLLESGTALIASDQLLLGVIVIGTIIALPLMLLVALIAAALSMHYGRYNRWSPKLGRLLYEIDHWSMVEVFLIGVLVSLTKIASMATVTFGWSFWAFIVFCFAFLFANASLDRHVFWQRIASTRT